ncbi:hypothetical protein CGCF413_v005139 [Colletotrichum fructicola]|nr:hypothetical protein CGCF413_v005139 [Colletotrichum fructicola]
MAAHKAQVKMGGGAGLPAARLKRRAVQYVPFPYLAILAGGWAAQGQRAVKENYERSTETVPLREVPWRNTSNFETIYDRACFL